MVGHEESRLVRWILGLWRSHGRTEGWVGAGGCEGSGLLCRCLRGPAGTESHSLGGV